MRGMVTSRKVSERENEVPASFTVWEHTAKVFPVGTNESCLVHNGTGTRVEEKVVSIEQGRHARIKNVTICQGLDTGWTQFKQSWRVE